MFQVVWSSVVHVFWCYSAFVVYISPILSLSCFVSPRVPITTGIIGGFHPPHSFTDFDLKVFIFWQFFSGMVISKSRQVLSSLFLITMSGLLAFSSRSVCQSLYWHLPQDCDTVFFCYCLCLYSSLCRWFGVDTGAPNDDLTLNTLKTLLRLPRVLKAFWGALWNLYLFGHPRATWAFSKL